MSIREINELVRNVCMQKNFVPFKEYHQRLKKSDLTLKFVKKAEDVFQQITSFDGLSFIDAEVKINAQEIDSKYRGTIIISMPYIIYPEKKEIVMLSFSHAEDIHQEIRMLKGLSLEFYMKNNWPEDYDKFSYWDVSTGEKCTERLRDAKSIPKEEILATLRRLAVSKTA